MSNVSNYAVPGFPNLELESWGTDFNSSLREWHDDGGNSKDSEDVVYSIKKKDLSGKKLSVLEKAELHHAMCRDAHNQTREDISGEDGAIRIKKQALRVHESLKKFLSQLKMRNPSFPTSLLSPISTANDTYSSFLIHLYLEYLRLRRMN